MSPRNLDHHHRRPAAQKRTDHEELAAVCGVLALHDPSLLDVVARCSIPPSRGSHVREQEAQRAIRLYFTPSSKWSLGLIVFGVVGLPTGEAGGIVLGLFIGVGGAVADGSPGSATSDMTGCGTGR